MLQKQKFDQEEKLGDLEREVETFKQKEKGISWNELKDNIFHLYSVDSAEVGVASVVQEDVRYHTTDGELSDDMLPHNMISCVKPNSQYMLRHLLCTIHVVILPTPSNEGYSRLHTLT